MMKRMMAAVLAAVLIGTLTPATFAFAQGNDPDAQRTRRNRKMQLQRKRHFPRWRS